MEDFIQFVIEEIPEKKKRGRPRKNKKTDLEGDGWIGDKLTAAKKLAQKGVRKVGSVVLGKERAERLERYGDATLFLSKLPLPPSVKEYLRKYGDEVISKATIVRNPVQKLLTGAMNAVSLGSFGKKFGRLPYDDLFHLQLWVTTPSGVFGIEKNEVITMTFNPKPAQNAEFKEVSVPADLTMNKLMLGSEKIQGDKWTRYDAYNNNCQDFVMSLLKGSGMGNEGDYQFVKQDTDSLFKNDSFLRKFARNLTNIGASVSTAFSGVDDKPISSTKSSDTFEIPSPTDTDIQEVPTGGAVKRGRGRPRKMKGGVEPRIELSLIDFINEVRRGVPDAVRVWNNAIPDAGVRAMLLQLPNELVIQVLQYLGIQFHLRNFRTTLDSPTQTKKRKDDPDDDDMGKPTKKRPTKAPRANFGSPQMLIF